MNAYETLLKKASDAGLNVSEKPLISCDGLIKGNRIAIRKNIETVTAKSCVLAEELGHHNTSVGNILDITDFQCAKQEHQARLWAYNEKIGLNGLIRAYENGCKERHEVAEFLEVTCEFLEDALNAYRNKYGVCTTVDNYVIIFIPNLLIGRIDM